MERGIFLNHPTLILGCGIAGSGKTTVLNEISRKIVNTFWIDKDTLNQSLMYNENGVMIPGSITSEYYQKYVKNQSYTYMLNEAKINIHLGKHPVIEGNYNRQIRTGYLDKVLFPFFAEEKCRIKIVYCYASEEVIFKRIISRAALRDEEKYRDTESWSKFIQEQPILPLELEKYDHIKINTDQQIETCAEEVIEYLLN